MAIGGNKSNEPLLAVVLAAVRTLPAELISLLHQEVTEMILGAGEPLDYAGRMKLRGIRLLRNVARKLGHSPTADEYEMERRAQGPETSAAEKLPHPRTLRSWFGAGSWNDCLRDARLEPVPDGDVILLAVRRKFERDELLKALQDCTAEIGYIPGFYAYAAWARRPEAVELPGRRPTSLGPFLRCFGSFPAAIEQAGLATPGEYVNGRPGTHSLRLGKYSYDLEEIRQVLREMAARIGRPPRSTEYEPLRESLMVEAGAEDRFRAVPSGTVVFGRYASWDDALVDAGLAPLGGRATVDYKRMRGNRCRWSDQELMDWLRRAYDELERPFSSCRYVRWRSEKIAEARRNKTHLRIPSFETIRRRLGEWAKAVSIALDWPPEDPTLHGAS
jgi:hypothetical protein